MTEPRPSWMPSDEEIRAKWAEFSRSARERYWESGCRVDASMDAPMALAGWLLGLVERACLKAQIAALMDFRVEVGNDTGIDEALSVWLDEYRARLAELEGA